MINGCCPECGEPHTDERHVCAGLSTSPSKALLESIYLVHDGNEVHTIHADDWTVSLNGLTFARGKARVAWFLAWNWWKRADA